MKMYNKEIMYGYDANLKLMNGINKLANAVKSTLGPAGRNVIIDVKDGIPVITKDGVTVANSIKLSDPFENMGAQLIKSVSLKANEVAGDGTTTATVLAHSILLESHEVFIDNKNINVVEYKRGLDKGMKAIIDELDNISVQVDDINSLKNVATISANGDEFIGDILSKAKDSVGKDGVITLNKSTSDETTLEIANGIEIPVGYISKLFINNSSDECEYDKNPEVLIFDDTIGTNDVRELLDIYFKNKKQLLIIAHDFDDNLVTTVTSNKSLNIVLVKSPYLNEFRTDVLTDIASMVNATVYKSGDNIQSHFLGSVGQASKVIVSSSKTSIIGGTICEDKQQFQINEVKNALEKPENVNKINSLEGRLGMLNDGVAIINIGASTEVEMMETYHRIEDALNATNAASEDGIVIGGGCALAKISKRLEGNITTSNESEKIAVKVLLNSIKEPLRQITKNAGYNDKDLMNEVISNTDINYGFNARTGIYGNLIDDGVIDPVKVTRSSLEYAVSVAGMILTTDVMVANIPDMGIDEENKLEELSRNY